MKPSGLESMWLELQFKIRNLEPTQAERDKITKGEPLITRICSPEGPNCIGKVAMPMIGDLKFQVQLRVHCQDRVQGETTVARHHKCTQDKTLQE